MRGKKSIGLFLLAAMAALSISCVGKTPKIEAPRAVASLEKVEINGVKQWILIRGNDVENPLLLFLHGGPGGCQIPYAHYYGYPLEEHFVVVQWDQRGAGKSYHPTIPPRTMTIDQFVSDTHELIRMLLDRFHKDKLYLVGKSWGTLLGVRVVQKDPSPFYAYVGMGQCVDLVQNEALSYRFVWEEANRLQNKPAIAQLKMIGPPPYSSELELAIQRYWLGKFGGIIYNPAGERAKIGRVSVEYTPSDVFKYYYGMLFSTLTMWDEIMTVNFLEQAPRLEVPVYFFTGRHDYNTPFELVELYYQRLDAPKGKHLVWFDQSGHSPNFEETDKFAREMLRVKKETYPGG